MSMTLKFSARKSIKYTGKQRLAIKQKAFSNN